MLGVEVQRLLRVLYLKANRRLARHGLGVSMFFFEGAELGVVLKGSKRKSTTSITIYDYYYY